EHQGTEGNDGAGGITEPVGQRDGAADGLAGQEGDRPERGIAHLEAGTARLRRGVAQRVVLQRLAGHPLVVLPTLPDDALPGSHATFWCNVSGHSVVTATCSAPIYV